jgi:hypothetical protein
MTIRHGLAEADWAEVKEEIRGILISLARTGTTISYASLAAQVTAAVMHHRAPVFHAILRELGAEDLEQGRPSLAVLVVRQDTGRCGSGFYKFAADRGADVSDPEVYWQSELAAVLDYWGEAR